MRVRFHDVSFLVAQFASAMRRESFSRSLSKFDDPPYLSRIYRIQILLHGAILTAKFAGRRKHVYPTSFTTDVPATYQNRRQSCTFRPEIVSGNLPKHPPYMSF